ncbi:unnamed protein product [Durusdinium trenchii]|uniref:Voltage-dependent P/Q-type calcium channel subunit alpha-1A n=2 Tax=Durusdinium trenchii TaxID=1381693 RepID=A0ABP0HQI5_9DINO
MMLLAVLLSSVSLTLAAFSQVVFEPEAATNSLLQLQLQLGKDSSAPEEESDDPADYWLSWCWDGHHPTDQEFFLLHIGKVGGCSLVADLSKLVNRSRIWTQQGCYAMSRAGHFKKTFVMLRRPRDLVLSMYHQCSWPGGPDSPEWHAMEELGVAPGMPGNILPDFATWVHTWSHDAPTEDYVAKPFWNDKFHCNDPRDMMSRFLTCVNPVGHPPSINASDAIQQMKNSTATGLLEAYHESICLYAVELTGSLPSHCNCEDAAAWSSFNETHITHDHTYNDTIEDYNQAVLEDVDAISSADRQLYRAGVQLFIHEMEKLESTFQVKVLCDEQREMLLEGILS